MERFLALYGIYFIIVFVLTFIGYSGGFQKLEAWLRSLSKPKPFLRPQRNYVFTKTRKEKFIPETIPFYTPVYVGNLLYHGTPRTEFADDILFHNKFLIKDHVPQGIYVSDKFETAKGYAAISGRVVLLLNEIPGIYTVDINDMYKDLRYRKWTQRFGRSGVSISRFIFEVLNMRLVRIYNSVFVAVVPYCRKGQYYRIEGLRPIKILDRNMNVIKSLD